MKVIDHPDFPECLTDVFRCRLKYHPNPVVKNYYAHVSEVFLQIHDSYSVMVLYCHEIKYEIYKRISREGIEQLNEIEEYQTDEWLQIISKIVFEVLMKPLTCQTGIIFPAAIRRFVEEISLHPDDEFKNLMDRYGIVEMFPIDTNEFDIIEFLIIDDNVENKVNQLWTSQGMIIINQPIINPPPIHEFVEVLNCNFNSILADQIKPVSKITGLLLK